MRTPILLLVLASCSTPTARPAPSPVIGWIHGEPFAISRSWVYAHDNENRNWSVVLASARGFPADFGDDLGAARVDVGGERRHPQSIGGDPRNTYFEFAADRAGAARWAQALGVAARGRIDPRLSVVAHLDVHPRASGNRSAPSLQLVLENGGRTPFTFLSSGEHAGPELEQRFKVTIERAGVVLPALPHRPWFGGLQALVTLAPGQSHSFELDPAEWSSVDAPGTYTVRVRCQLEIQPPSEPGMDPYDHAHERWDQATRAECTFVVEP